MSIRLSFPSRATPPILIDLPKGCPFADRCPVAQASCRSEEPSLTPVLDSPGHTAACVRSHEISGSGMLGDRPVFPAPPPLQNALKQVPREEREVTLSVNNLTKTFPVLKGALVKRKVGEVQAVKGVSFDIRAGETMAIVGESGSGKTTTLLQIMDFTQQSDGEISVAGTNVNTIRSRTDERRLRREIQIVFQDPMGSFDPRMTVADVIAEPMIAIGTRRADADARVSDLMQRVGLDPAHADRFPSAFSGGQRQRIGIARALSTSPKIIVLDEPVSALDVSIQAGILNLLGELQAELGLSYLLVAHDLSVVRHIADRVAVMFRGSFVEQGDVNDIFARPQHPYTKALLSAIPIPDPVVERRRERITWAAPEQDPARG